ncbi:hypothetical protein TRVL_03442 [Trypanosoma vivax]|nr:hypothetical protein TRVL_03442 [Trypanosoma vivax]
MSVHKCITVQFAGGCELLFAKQTVLQLNNVVPHGTTVNGLVQLLRDEYVNERPDLLMDQTGTSLRPGILVLVNACDAEVVGGLDYTLCEGDTVELISTLHGG